MMAAMRLFHGCPDANAARRILCEGLRAARRPTIDGPAGALAPLPGRVYFAQDRAVAMNYARLPGRFDWGGTRFPDDAPGVLFQVEVPRDTPGLLIDEDDLGEALTIALRVTGAVADAPAPDGAVLELGNQRLCDWVVREPNLAAALVAAAACLSTQERQALACQDDTAPRGDLIAGAGKTLLAHGLSDALAGRLIDAGANVSLPAPVRVERAFQVPRDGRPLFAPSLDLLLPWPEETRTEACGLRL
jgi:hypothetical protein